MPHCSIIIGVNEGKRESEGLTTALENTDHVDFYPLHGLSGESWDRCVRLGVLDFLDRAVADGRVRFPAFSFHGELAVYGRA